MTLMRSPDGEEREIKPEGVASLSRLGWEPVEESKKAPAKAASKKSEK